MRESVRRFTASFALSAGVVFLGGAGCSSPMFHVNVYGTVQPVDATVAPDLQHGIYAHVRSGKTSGANDMQRRILDDQAATKVAPLVAGKATVRFKTDEDPQPDSVTVDVGPDGCFKLAAPVTTDAKLIAVGVRVESPGFQPEDQLSPVGMPKDGEWVDVGVQAVLAK